MRKTIVCLANSYKHGGRCVAGISLEDGCWVRLRGGAHDGSLSPEEYRLDDGSEVRVGDAIEVDLHFAIPSDHHPEDWVTAPGAWTLVERPVSDATWDAVKACAGATSGMLRGYRDRMRVKEVFANPLLQSLALIGPSETWWWIREDGGKRKYRALFRHQHVTYDLSLTDPAWLARLSALPPASIHMRRSPRGTRAPG